jgi:WD40 repeat protein
MVDKHFDYSPDYKYIWPTGLVFTTIGHSEFGVGWRILFRHRLLIYNINTGILVTTLYGHIHGVFDLVFRPNGNVLASSGRDSTVILWDLTTYTQKSVLLGHSAMVYGLKLISNNVLSSGLWDRTIKFWDINTGSLIRTLTGQTSDIIYSVDMLSDGKTFVSGSEDRTIKL